jgi:nicotinate-nucleotide adenylyltransferase
MKEGILGGTFDPPHMGHLIVAESARQSLGLDRIRVIPAGAPPHKNDGEVTAGRIRREMVEHAVAGNALYLVDGREIERSGPSYTVDTLTELRREQPGTQFTLLIGMDNATEFATWRDPERILELVNVAALWRPGDARELEGDFRDRIAVVRTPLIEISSSDIRARVRAGLSIRYLVPECVERDIKEMGLYRGSGA